ncbi:hypothetical protein [Arthrobacter sp. PsM3]|uniref:hypothetical protein n=1 Tax=Arthrobacter sp. PsM3 TaxID=3030531 RepID=UPI00263B68F5|nr:hypothetical protein [Arthrobacter sp. PsM3]MDN4646192.1 hypothetical protein [Arthrobacter sp. PsM3]
MPKISSGPPSSRIRDWRLYAFLIQTISRARTVSVPYRLGDVVVGDDPFNGRTLGLVAVMNGTSVGLQTADRTFYYDYRQLTRPD